MLPDLSKPTELALMLQHSNVPEVSDLAKGFLALEASYGELRQAYLRVNAELIMRRHSKLLEKLKDSEDVEKEEE